jgi:hypothetical protein
MEKFGLQALAPQPDGHSFEEWWDRVSRKVPDQVSKGPNSICYPSGMVPGITNLSRLLSTIKDEQHVWELAEARGIVHLIALQPNV